jgi:hypothetical protein
MQTLSAKFRLIIGTKFREINFNFLFFKIKKIDFRIHLCINYIYITGILYNVQTALYEISDAKPYRIYFHKTMNVW